MILNLHPVVQNQELSRFIHLDPEQLLTFVSLPQPNGKKVGG